MKKRDTKENGIQTIPPNDMIPECTFEYPAFHTEVTIYIGTDTRWYLTPHCLIIDIHALKWN